MQPLPDVAIEWLTAQGADLSWYDDGWPADADEVEALIYYSVHIDKPLLDKLPALRVIGKRGAGVDTLDLAEIERRGIVVTNVGAGGNASSVCEQALTLLMAATRDVVRRDAFTRAGNFTRRFELPLYEEVGGSRVGIMGAGNIGRRLIEILHNGLDCKIGVYDPYAKTDDLPVRRFDELGDMFSWADNVIIAAPLTEESRGSVGRHELALLGPQGVVVVISRGGHRQRGRAGRRPARGRHPRGGRRRLRPRAPRRRPSVLRRAQHRAVAPRRGGQPPVTEQNLPDVRPAGVGAAARPGGAGDRCPALAGQPSDNGHAVKVSVQEAGDFGARVLVGLGTPADIAEQVAGWLVGADLAGHASHGIVRLMDYADRIARGTLDPAGRAEVRPLPGRAADGPVVWSTPTRDTATPRPRCSPMNSSIGPERPRRLDRRRGQRLPHRPAWRMVGAGRTVRRHPLPLLCQPRQVQCRRLRRSRGPPRHQPADDRCACGRR